MPSKLVLLGVSSVAVGTAGASTYVIYNNSKSFKKLKDLFDATNGRVLLDAIGDKHDRVWEQIFKEHNVSSKRVEGIISKGTLKDYCKKTSDSFNEGDLDSYSLWCSRNTFKAQMNNSTKKWNDSIEDSDWEENKKAYSQESTEDFLITKEGVQGTVSKSSVTPKDLKEWCFGRAKLPFIDTSDKDYLIADKFCFTVK